jgi:hypothetical protein
MVVSLTMGSVLSSLGCWLKGYSLEIQMVDSMIRFELDKTLLPKGTSEPER